MSENIEATEKKAAPEIEKIDIFECFEYLNSIEL